MIGPSEGSWRLDSKSDPQWNCEGRGIVGFGSCPAVEQKVKELKKILGEPPADLTVTAMKD